MVPLRRWWLLLLTRALLRLGRWSCTIRRSRSTSSTRATGLHANISESANLDGDGNEDFVLLRWTFPTSEVTAANYRPQPGRVFLGDGDGGFRRAPTELFAVDLNGDGLPDMFIAAHSRGRRTGPW